MVPRKCVTQIHAYVPGKPIEQVQRELGLAQVVKLASNENPLGPSPLAIQAMRDHADQVFLYPDGSGYGLKQSLATHWHMEPHQIVIGNGSDELLQLLALTYLEPGDEVVSADTTFPRYLSVTQLCDANYIAVGMRDLTFDLSAILRAVTDKTKMIIICNPNNPTGTFVGRAALDAFMDQIPERILVVLDEAYFEYADHQDFPDGLTYVRQKKNVVVLRTFSKVYGLAGLRVGYGMAQPEVIEYLERVRSPFNVNRLAQEAAVVSLRDQDYVHQSVTSNAEGRRYLAELLSNMGFKVWPSQGNFLFFDCYHDSKQITDQLLHKGIIVRGGFLFGYPTCIRVTVGTQEQNELFMTVCQQVIKEA